MKTLGERIKHLRIQKGLSMDGLRSALAIPMQEEDEELIAFVKISTATISNLENNKHKPTSDIVVALSRFFKVSCDWILTGKEFSYGQISEETRKEAEEATLKITQMIERMRIEQEALNKTMDTFFELLPESK
jgi:transcriptional regulator with XRE-family HTH domain